MIQHLKIRNYKTVQALDLPCKRFNVFIGDTSTGKTNILEALTLLSQGIIRHDADLKAQALDKRVIRYDRLSELFTNADVRLAIHVEADQLGLVATFDGSTEATTFLYSDGSGKRAEYRFLPAGNTVYLPESDSRFEVPLRRYEFDPAVVFGAHWFPHLAPTDGHNLTVVLLGHPDLLAEVDEIMSAKDIHISIDRDGHRISQRIDLARNVSVHLSWSTVSETIRRYIFLYTAVRSNANAVLLLDEPERNTFPFYTKHLAEVMAREPSNQYFISTHSQYLLQSLVEKAPAEEIQIIATFRKDGVTQVRVLPLPEVLDMMQYDLFLNLDRLVEG